MKEQSSASVSDIELENKKLHDIIKQQQERLDDILSSVNEVIWSRRAKDHSLSYINNACLKIYGYTPEELLKNNGIFLDHIHPNDRIALDEQIKKVLENDSGELEYRIFHKDGSIRYIFGQANLKRDDQGNPLVFNGTSVDITHVRKVEEDLRKKADEIEDILGSITDSFIALDKNFNFTYVNKEAERLYNCKKEDLLNKNIWDTFPKGLELQFYPNLVRALEKQVTVQFEEYSPTANIWVSVNVYPTRDGLAIYFRDVTEHRKLQDKLLNNEKSLRAIINNTKDIIWSMDTNMALISANQAYYDRIAYLTQNKNYEDVTNDDFARERVEKWTNYFSKALNDETFKVIEKDVIVDNKAVFEEISFNPIHDKDNNIVGVSCFSRDITEQKNLQDKIINDQRNLLALINNTSDFIWSVDKSLNVVSINDSYKDFIYNLANRIIKSGDNIIYDSLTNERKESWKKHYEKALTGKRVIFVEEEIINNEKHHREVRLHPIIDKNENIVGVSCSSRDISAETRLNEKIHKNEQNLLATVNNTNDSIWSIDKDLKLILINQASKDFVYRMTGINAEPGSYALWKGLPDDFLQERKKNYERALTGEAFKVINDLDWNENKPCYETSFNPIRDSKGNVLGVSCVARDISAHLKQIKKIQEQNEKLTEIASILSHNVRGPVASILGLVQLFGEKDFSDPINREIADGITLAANELDGIIHEVVDKTSTIQNH